MARTPIWQSISSSLSTEIAEGIYRPGDRLPTEAELSARFGVNRHTVRQALASLAAAGTVHSRRGAGVFVTATPTDYPLGRRVRFHQNVAASGRSPSRRLTLLETRLASSKERDALSLRDAEMVHVIEGLSLIDAQPVARFRSVLPAARFPDLLGHLEDQTSLTFALRASGLEDYTRQETRLTAKLATPLLALHLQVKEGAPILRSVAINADAAGKPVEYGTTWFAGDRVTLTLSAEGAG